MRQRIRLTESELRYLIEQSVNEALIEEGVWDGAKTVGQKALNWMGRQGKNLQKSASKNLDNVKDNVKGAFQTAKDNVTGAYNTAKDNVTGAYKTAKKNVKGAYKNAKDNVTGAYENVRDAYNMGSRVGDAEKNVNTACSALENLINTENNLAKKGFTPIFNTNQIRYINNFCATLRKYSQKFSAMRDNYTNPSGQQPPQQ